MNLEAMFKFEDQEFVKKTYPDIYEKMVLYCSKIRNIDILMEELICAFKRGLSSGGLSAILDQIDCGGKNVEEAFRHFIKEKYDLIGSIRSIVPKVIPIFFINGYYIGYENEVNLSAGTIYDEEYYITGDIFGKRPYNYNIDDEE